MASLQAHVAEHLGFNYRRQIEERLGVPMPPPHSELPEEVEVNLARLVADAAKQLTQSHQQQVAQQKAQQEAKDPILQLRRQEAQTKQADVQRKAQKDAADTQLQQADLQRKAQKDLVDAAVSAQRVELEKVKTVVDAKQDQVKLDADTRRETDKLDLEIFKAVTTPPPSPPSNNKKE